MLEANPSNAKAAKPRMMQKRKALACSDESRIPRMSLFALTATTLAKFAGTSRSKGLASAESNSHMNETLRPQFRSTMRTLFEMFFQR